MKKHSTIAAVIAAALLTACASGTSKLNPPDITANKPTPNPSTVSLNDFQIDLIVLDSECFGSAGANVTAEPNLSIDGGEFDGQATLVYDVRGGEAVETHSMELNGSSYTYDKLFISTASCNFNLTATPTRLITR